MMRTTLSVLAALMLGGASVALAGGAGKSTSDQSQSPARSEADSSGSGTTSGMSAGGSSSSSGMSAGESSKAGSSSMSPSTSSGASSSTTGGATAGSASQMSAADIEAKLEKQGYTQVTGVKKVGDKFEAKAMKNGKSVEVEVDPVTGMVKDKS